MVSQPMKTLTVVSLAGVIAFGFPDVLTAQNTNSGNTPDSAVSAASDTLAIILMRADGDSAVRDSTQQQDTRSRDQWGVAKNPMMAVGEILIVNALVWGFNEYPRGASFTQVNPRSWYNNLSGGWKWDDNHFSTNMFAHPFHGNLYYNAARSNGFNFWASVPFAFLGSGFWECCGETHSPAINDWLSTSISGSIIGESLYRISSSILDNEATGSERVWREIGAAALNPVRGFSRLTDGRMTGTSPNPERREEWRPARIDHTLSIGARRVLDQGALEETDNTTGFVLFDYRYGDPFESGVKPFDYFRMQFQLNSRDKQVIGRWQIRGILANTVLKESPSHRMILGATLNYDYINNNALEFGGNDVTGSLASIWRLSSKFSLAAELGLVAQIFGAVNSEFAFIVETPGQERLREYDFGVGGGGRAGLTVFWSGREFIKAQYRFLFLHALNGAVGTLPEIGDINADHRLQALVASVNVPVVGKFGLGADFSWYQRRTDNNNDQLQIVTQRVREARLFATWELSLSGEPGNN